jgi:hypothetical protein
MQPVRRGDSEPGRTTRASGAAEPGRRHSRQPGRQRAADLTAGYRRQAPCGTSAGQLRATAPQTAPHSPQTDCPGRADPPGSIPATCDLIHASARTQNRSDDYIRKRPVTWEPPYGIEP